MQGWRSDRRFQAYLVVTAFAALCAVLAPAPAPLPRLEPGGGGADAPLDARALAQTVAEAGQAREISSQAQTETAALGDQSGDDLKDAVAAGPMAPSGLGAGHFTTMWIAQAGRMPAAQISWQSAAKAAAAPGSKTRGETAPRESERASSPMYRNGARPSFGASHAQPASLRVAADKARETISSAARGQNARPEAGARADRNKSSDRGSAGGGLWRAAHSKGFTAGRETAVKGKDDKDEKSKQPPKHRPFLRHKRLGAPKPPKISKVPAQNPWTEAAPKTLEDGRELVPVPPKTLAEVEAIAPPEGKTDHLPAAHWHVDGAEQLYHDGQRWGREADGRWTWLEHSSGHWWLWVNPGDPPLLWHEDHWWWQSRGTWFVLHDGDAWVYRYINDWQQEGLTHQDGSQMVYSPDGGEVGVLEPGKGARFYDAESGKSMGELAENEMPERNRPNVPTQLSLPQ
jgi:hypothetical protein